MLAILKQAGAADSWSTLIFLALLETVAPMNKGVSQTDGKSKLSLFQRENSQARRTEYYILELESMKLVDNLRREQFKQRIRVVTRGTY